MFCRYILYILIFIYTYKYMYLYIYINIYICIYILHHYTISYYYSGKTTSENKLIAVVTLYLF